MIEKVNLKHLLCIAAACLAINFMFVGCGKSATIGELQADTDRAMGAVKTESAGIGVEITRSQTASDNAAEAIGRTQSEISGSREAVSNLNAGITKLQTILAECERLARENAEIIAGVDCSN